MKLLAAALVLLAAAAAVPDPAAPVDYGDPTLAVSAVVPDGWHRARTLTALAFPREVLTIASFPLRRGGNCGPDRALRDLGPHDALIFVIEYRPANGPVWWRGVRRSRFPLRPARLRLPTHAAQPAECFARPAYTVRFRDADRPLQIEVILGTRVTPAERRRVERVLDGLRFGSLPAPPPDPFAGWRTLVDESGDALRVPPHWSRHVTAVPRRLPRPRTLFLTSNKRLAGAGSALPAATPGLTQPSAGAVALWIVEERPGAPSRAYPRRVRRQVWPRPQDFADAPESSAARLWPGLRWRRAGMSWRGLRFSAWIAAGPRAGAADVGLAEQSAASTGLSAALRDCAGRLDRGACRRPLPRRLQLRKPSYLGVRCPVANSLTCDRAGLAVWLRRPVRRLEATIDGRRFALRPPQQRDGFWEGVMRNAGFLRPGAALHVVPAGKRGHWEGLGAPRVVVRLTATAPDGATERADVVVDLRAGYG
jgi:hypothetical protein